MLVWPDSPLYAPHPSPATLCSTPLRQTRPAFSNAALTASERPRIPLARRSYRSIGPPLGIDAPYHTLEALFALPARLGYNLRRPSSGQPGVTAGSSPRVLDAPRRPHESRITARNGLPPRPSRSPGHKALLGGGPLSPCARYAPTSPCAAATCGHNLKSLFRLLLPLAAASTKPDARRGSPCPRDTDEELLRDAL